MKKFNAVFLTAISFIALGYSCVFPAPDPRDSVIIESKTVNPATGHPAAYVKVYITNRDSLKALMLALLEKSVTGGAYATLGRPRADSGVVRRLTSTLNGTTFFAGIRYNSVSPDTFTIASFFQPGNNANLEPPNSTRKAFLEIKFDTVKSSLGTFELDSAYIVNGQSIVSTSFNDMRARTIPVNFKKGTITVASGGGGDPCRAFQLDMERDGFLTVTDAVLLLNCVFGGASGCKEAYTTADLILLLNFIFTSEKRTIPLLPPPGC